MAITMSGVSIQGRAKAGQAAPSDPYYANVGLLLHFTGVNNSTVFTDNSPSPKTLLANGDAKISTALYEFSPSSGIFDGNADYLTTNAGSSVAFGTGDFTVECWVYTSVFGNNGVFQIATTNPGFGGVTGLAVAFGSGKVNLFYGNGSSTISTGTSLTSNTWTHVAVVRSSSVTKVYLNGVLDTTFGTAGSLADTFNYVGTFVTIGGYYSSSFVWSGNIDEFRITKGVARYTSNFTPTGPFPNQ